MSEIHLLKPLSISDSREHQSAERSKPARYQLFANELYYAYGGFRGKRSFPQKLLYTFPPRMGERHVCVVALFAKANKGVAKGQGG